MSLPIPDFQGFIIPGFHFDSLRCQGWNTFEWPSVIDHCEKRHFGMDSLTNIPISHSCGRLGKDIIVVIMTCFSGLICCL